MALNQSIESEEAFSVTFENPCTDPLLTSITPKTLASKIYFIYGNELTWDHEAFDLVTSPVHTLCGPLETIVTFDTGANELTVTDSTTPMTYEV